MFFGWFERPQSHHHYYAGSPRFVRVRASPIPESQSGDAFHFAQAATGLGRLLYPARLLRADGRIVNLVSFPDIYRHEWASFSTRDFLDDRRAQSGDTVRIIVTDVEDSRRNTSCAPMRTMGPCTGAPASNRLQPTGH